MKNSMIHSMEKISKRRFYFSLFIEIISFIAALCGLCSAYFDTEHAVYHALFTIWMYLVNKDAEKITNQYIKQEKDNEFTR